MIVNPAIGTVEGISGSDDSVITMSVMEEGDGLCINHQLVVANLRYVKHKSVGFLVDSLFFFSVYEVYLTAALSFANMPFNRFYLSFFFGKFENDAVFSSTILSSQKAVLFFFSFKMHSKMLKKRHFQEYSDEVKSMSEACFGFQALFSQDSRRRSKIPIALPVRFKFFSVLTIRFHKIVLKIS